MKVSAPVASSASDPFGLALRRAAIFLGSAFIVLSLHDLVLRELRGTAFTGVRSTIEGLVLMALCVLPGAIAGFWRHRATSFTALMIFAMAAGYIAAFLGLITASEPLSPEPKRFFGLAVTFLGPYVAIWLGAQVQAARKGAGTTP